MPDIEMYIESTESFITETNEIVNSEDKKNFNRGPQWFKGIRSGFRTLAKFKLTASDLNVFLWLAGSLKYGSEVVVNQKEIAKHLGMNNATVSRSITVLVSHNILVSSGKVGGLIRYKIHPAYCWTGANKSLKSA